MWLWLCASTAVGMGSVPGRGTKIRHASWHGPEMKNCIKMSLDKLSISPYFFLLACARFLFLVGCEMHGQ